MASAEATSAIFLIEFILIIIDSGKRTYRLQVTLRKAGQVLY